ncbi:MAG TPA: hypothetical protein VEB68_03735 [Croceibacterium sp.]|nr:hypothetical protein [Croceibacterium sp.]
MHTDLSLGYAAALARTRREPRIRLREALLGLAGEHATIVSHDEKSWASITFAGARHRIELVFEGAEGTQAGELFIAFLPEHEFTIPGQLVADAAVTAVDHRLDPPRLQVSCELLLLEEG